LVAQRLPQGHIFGEFNASARAPGPLTVIKACDVKPPLNFSLLYSDVKFLNDIYRRLDIKLKSLPPRPWIGLHIRRTDAFNLSKKLEKELPSMETYIEFIKTSSKESTFHCLLCTDDSDVIELMNYRLGHHRVTVLSDPKNMNFIKTNYGMRPDAGIDILIDALVLSNCNYFLGTPCSSVSETIELWKKAKKV
jgi:hypothetical protein